MAAIGGIAPVHPDDEMARFPVHGAAMETAGVDREHLAVLVQ